MKTLTEPLMSSGKGLQRSGFSVWPHISPPSGQKVECRFKGLASSSMFQSQKLDPSFLLPLKAAEGFGINTG